MITEALVRLVTVLLEGVDAVLPDWDWSLPSGVKQLLGYVLSCDSWLPMSELLTVVGVMLSATVAYVGFKWLVKLIDWIADVIP